MTPWRTAFVFLGCAIVSAAAFAQARPGDYPNRPVRIMVPTPAGGPMDLLARQIGTFAERRWKQPLIVENRPGASSLIATEAVVRSPPDGYTLLVTSINVAYEHVLNPNWPYHPIRDFSHLGLVAGTGFALTTHPGLPVRNFSEFVAYAKANRGKLNRATGGTVSPHMEEQLFRTGLGDAFVNVMYKGGPQSVQAVAAGEVQLWNAAPQDVLELARQGRVRILAYTERQRHPLMPDVPTVAESKVGADDYDAIFWFTLLGPPGMPAPLVAFLNAEMKEFVRQPDVLQRIEALGYRPFSASPDDVRAQFDALARYAQDMAARSAKR